jgi:outer membrane lipoprotein-sorting protein
MTFVLAVCPLAACGRSVAIDDAEAVRALYADLRRCSLQAALTADFGDAVSEFTLRFDYNREGESAVEILAPEEVRGVRATIGAGETTLSYDGLILETGPLPGTGLTPVDALPVMLKTWGEGYVSSTGREKLDGVACLLVVYKSTAAGVEVEQRVWFETETYKPVRAETYAANARVIACAFEKFSFES